MSRAYLLPLLVMLAACRTPATGATPATDLCRSIEAATRAADPSLATWTEGAPATESTRAPLTAAARDFIRRCAPAEAEALTAELVRFPTVSAREAPADGPAFEAMRAHLEGWAKARGFAFESTEKNGAWIVSTASAAPSVAFVMHADVVPVTAEGVETPKSQDSLPPGWSYPPFELTRVGDKLYGRGTEDDKGPIAAVLVTLHTLKRFGLLPESSIQAIMGTGEESDWSGMKAFVKSRPQAPNVISLDASFPVVIAESGFVAWTLEFPRLGPASERRCAAVKEVDAGQFLTQVPGEGRLVLEAKPGLAEAAKAAAAKAVSKLGDARLKVEVEAREDGIVMRSFGDAVHSSEADSGANAMWALAEAAGHLDLCPGATRDVLGVLRRLFVGDHWGERLGLAYAHEVMGRLLVTPTVLKSESTKVVLRVNMRRPAGRTVADFASDLDAAFAQVKATAPAVTEPEGGRYVGEPALVDPSSKLVRTLVEIYREASGDADAAPKSIRGGTYARLFDNAVSFGPAIPGRTYRGHAPDEYLEQEALELMLVTALEAALRLAD